LFQLLKRIVKQSLAYALGTILNRAVSVVMLPFYTRHLSKPDVGILEILLITTTILLYILQLGMGSALFRSALYKKNVDRKEITSTAYLFVGGFALVSIVTLIFLARPLAALLFDDPDQARLLRIIFAGDFFLLLNVVPMAILRIDQRSNRFAQIAGASFFISIGLNILYLVVLDRGVEGVVTANALSAALFSIIFFVSVRTEIGLAFSWKELRDMLGFGLPLVPGVAGDMVLMMSDRYFLRFYWGLDEVAVYGVALRIGIVISLVVSAFQMAWPAIFFPMVREKEAPVRISRLFSYFLIMLTTFGLGLSIFARDLFTVLVTERFIEGAAVIPLIALAFLFYGIYYFSAIGIQVEKKTGYYALMMGVAAVVAIGFNFILVPGWGIMGAAVAKMMAFACLGLGIAAISQRYYAIPYEWGRIVRIGLSACVLYALARLIPSGLAPAPLLARLMVFSLFPVALWVSGFYNKSERSFIRNRLRNVVRS